jgi:hypothetical protein
MKRVGVVLFVLLLVVVAIRLTPVRTAEPLITFDHYHTYAEITAFLKAVTQAHKDLAQLVQIGESRGKRPIYAVEINNPKTGPAKEKPAFYIDGNIHGGEVVGGETALYMVNLFLERGASDPDVKKQLETTAFYIVPIVNPDGRVISVETPENHRWNIRPFDDDGDGRIDEDPPEDLDKDGRILQMRIKDPNGRWKVSPDDPRAMVARSKDETGGGTYYSTYSEGVDNDADGRFNEDTVGGVDVNRNFPANWSATQFASGPYPLSEPESRALVEYMTSRPNIAAVHTFHTSGGMLLRFPTLADQSWDFPDSDINDYRMIGERGAEITGYTNDWDKKVVVDMMAPGHGVFNDWASLVYGVTAITTEMWRHPRSRGGANKEMLAWSDRVLGPSGFIGWHPFQHPQLGAIELGGFDKWAISSPPERLMEAEVERNARWVLTFSERVPRVAIQRAEATAVPGAKGTFDIQAVVANVGWLPTATAHAANVLNTAKPVVARIVLSNLELVGEAAGAAAEAPPRGREVPRAAYPGDRTLGVLPGARAQGPSVIPVTWQVRVIDAAKPASAEVVIISEKAGAARRRVNLTVTSR